MIARFFAVLMFLATHAAAEPILVRSGEHEDFSRLVVMTPAGAEWELDREAGGYRLTLALEEAEFLLDQVFRFIPRSRVQEIVPSKRPAGLLFKTAASISATAFQLDGGGIVLDFGEGPAVAERAPEMRGASEILEPPKEQVRTYPRVPINTLFFFDFSGVDTALAAAVSPAPSILRDIPKAEGARIHEAEKGLIEQLGRAAAQGLLHVPLHRSSEPGEAASSPIGERPDPASRNLGEVTDHLAIRSQTAIDRDAGGKSGRSMSGLAGDGCPSEDTFDVASWIDETPASVQISAGRRDLFGEFDRAAPEDVLRLARTYIAFGFGAEARELVESFDLSGQDALAIGLMADVLSDRTPIAPFEVAQFANCDGAAALWAVLATSGDVPPPINLAALKRTYSALPAHFRGFIGERLVNRLIELGEDEAADSILASLERASPLERGAPEMMAAQIQLASGQVEDAILRLEHVAGKDIYQSPRALALAIEQKVAHHEVVEPHLTETAAALAFELQADPLGAPLQRASALGLGSVGAFDAAFEAAGALSDFLDGGGLLDPTLADLFQMVARIELDPLFLKAYFRERQRIPQDGLTAETRLFLAERLVGLGFPRAAREALDQGTRALARGRRVLARAALSERDGPAALAYLSGLEGDAEDRLRAGAFMLVADYPAAMALYHRLGAQDQARQAAWLAGSWGDVFQSGREEEKAFLRAFEVAEGAPHSASPDASDQGGVATASGTLSRAQSLLESSAAEREALDRLLRVLEPSSLGD